MRTPIICAALLISSTALAQISATVEHINNHEANKAFAFKTVPLPAKDDAAATARIRMIDGERDPLVATPRVLHDGRLPSQPDEPDANFCFAEKTDGGVLTIDLGSSISIKQVNTYSWHPSTRAPQVYTLYAADGSEPNFDARPKRSEIAARGWKRLCDVDTRPNPHAHSQDQGGQYGASIADKSGPLGSYRYLLLDIHQTESDDTFGNTFFSEIDVIDAANPTPSPAAALEKKVSTFHTADNHYTFTIDSTQAPDLTDWADHKLAPVLLEWYPKIVAMLPSDGYTAPASFTIELQDPGRGVAATGGTHITCAAPWFRHNLEGEAVGAVVHEAVHVAQQYGRRHHNGQYTPPPGWLVEGIPDYIRWFLYEPQSHGADHVRPQDARYDAGYRTSANFLNFVVNKYDKDLIQKLNAACREGRDTSEVFKQATGKTIEDLAQEWKAQL